MAHQLPGVKESQQSEDAHGTEHSVSDTGSLRSSSYHSNDDTASRRVMLDPLQRSNPIAIARPRTKNDPYYTSVDDDDDDDEESDTRNLDHQKRSAAQSLPSRLLRAPLLSSSIPSKNDDYNLDHQQTMLPPPMFLTDGNEPRQPDTPHQSHIGMTKDPVSYGSLRDSHTRGKFLDGPASYRDKRTGGIKQLQHRVRFQDGTDIAASSLPPPASQLLTIGDRMRRPNPTGETQLSHDERSFSKKQGSLGDMLEASPTFASDNHMRMTGQPSPPRLELHPPSSFESTNDDDNFQAGNMLSTSLTALEVLQSGMLPERSQVVGFQGGPQSLPRNTLGHNALMSRTLSEPMPHRQLQPTMTSNSIFTSERYQDNNIHHTALQEQLNVASLLPSLPEYQQNAHNQQGSTNRGMMVAQFQAPQAYEQQPQHHHHRNPYAHTGASQTLGEHGASPDVEGAFDMDLEM